MIDPTSSQWDVLIIGGKRSPGVVRVSGNDLKYGWDVQEANATAGAVTKRINEPLKKFDAEFDLSNELDDLNVSDFDLWDEFQRLLESAVVTGKKPFALDVYHPDLARNHITSVTVANIGGLTLDGSGGGKIKVSFMEFRPPKPLRSVASTKTEGDKKIDAQLKELDALDKEWQTVSAPPPPPKKSTIGDSL